MPLGPGILADIYHLSRVGTWDIAIFIAVRTVAAFAPILC
jgi:hypothetical protein